MSAQGPNDGMVTTLDLISEDGNLSNRVRGYSVRENSDSEEFIVCSKVFRTSGVLSYFDFHLIRCNLTLTRLLHGVDRGLVRKSA